MRTGCDIRAKDSDSTTEQQPTTHFWATEILHSHTLHGEAMVAVSCDRQ